MRLEFAFCAYIMKELIKGIVTIGDNIIFTGGSNAVATMILPRGKEQQKCKTQTTKKQPMWMWNFWPMASGWCALSPISAGWPRIPMGKILHFAPWYICIYHTTAGYACYTNSHQSLASGNSSDVCYNQGQDQCSHHVTSYPVFVMTASLPPRGTCA